MQEMKDVRLTLVFLVGFLFHHISGHSQCGPIISTFPYTEDFEAAPAWTTGGANNDWAWGTPANTTINSAGGGTNCWIAGGLTGNSYVNSEQAWIMSPCFDFSSLNYPWISFKIFWECERQWDGMVFQYSLNGGTTWANVGAFGDPVNCLNQNWFNFNNITWLNTLPAGTRHGWSGRIGATAGPCTGGFGSTTWVTAAHCMTALANQPSVRFRFMFGSGTTCNAYDGIAIDDILIQNTVPNNVNFSSACAGGLAINFTNLSTMCPTAYSWNFDDPASGGANTSAATNPSHTFSVAGTYNVSLTASGPCNAPSTIIIPVAVTSTTIVFTDVTCNGANDGTATANPTGGVGPFSYSWNTLPIQTSQTATGLSPGTYTVTVSALGSCSSTSTVSIGQPPVLNLTVTAYNDENCGMNNGSITVNPIGGNGGNVFSWAPSGGSVSVASSLVAGSYTCTVTDAQGCTSSTGALINLLPPAAPVVGNTGPFCQGGTIQLNSSAGISYSWNGPGGFTSGVQNTTIGSATIGMSGIYTVVVTASAGCTSSGTTTVIVNPAPIANANNTGPYCPNSTIQLNANGGINYSWNGPLGFSSSSSNPSIGSATTGMAGIYTVVVTDAMSCSTTTSTSVTVNANPIANANNTGPYCNGSTIQLNGLGGTGYSWTGPLAFSSGVQNPTIGAAVAGMAGTYSITVTDINGCTATATTTVAINGSLLVIAGSNTPLCVGSQLDLTAVNIPGANFNWVGPNGFTAVGQQNPSIPAVTILASGTYTVAATDVLGCTGTASVNILVNSNPILVANNNGPVCEGTNLNLSANGGIGFDWVGPNVYSQPGVQNPAISNALPINSGIYTVTVTDGNGCSTTATTTALVNATPVANAGNTGPVCSGTNLVLTSGGGNGYAWAGPNGFIDPVNQNPIIAGATVLNSGTYTVLVTDINGCTDAATSTVTVNPLPNVVANLNAPLCAGATINLNAAGAVAYSWAGPGGFSSAISNPSIAGAGIINNGSYTVTGTDAIGCSITTTININISPAPIASFSGNQLAGCAPLCVNFSDLSTVIGSSIAAWNWSVETQPASAVQNPVFCFNNPGLFDASLTVTTADGCTTTISLPDYITVSVSPTAAFTYSPDIIYESEPQVSFTNISSGAIGYLWDLGEGTTSNLFEPVYSYSDTGTFCISLIASNAAGCFDTTLHCLQVIPDYSLYIPNTFTPNGDELNEQFMVYGRGVATLDARIFDRWGEEIFQFSDIQKGWPGTLKNGGFCEMGVYVYKISVTNYAGDSFEFMGKVNLLR